ncbi:MAG TPA: hypothetical protein EYH02_02245 [Ignisphaera aggregans]|uniref:Uncharacterized protein n=1 Tax=Ignisphaera aggregans TaxID=334771 RepID=A0A832YYJ0_9CREN|nr:hypothetical protein [Ignisphaera aggregans]
MESKDGSMIFRIAALIALAIGFALNILALKLTAKIVKRYRLAERGHHVERMLRKAGISSKKRAIASYQVKRLRSSLFKTSLLQFIVPFTVFLLTLIASSLAVSYVLFKHIGVASPVIVLVGSCIAFVPLEVPSDSTCTVYVVWLQFLIFLLFSPWYSYEIRKAVERSKA